MEPVAEYLLAKRLPAHYEGLHLTEVEAESGKMYDRLSPVLIWQGYLYVIYGYQDNRYAFVIVAYNGDGSVASQWERNGARYIHKITVDTVMEIVTFWGQDDKPETFLWLDLDLNRQI